jgi:hypothetical protein
MSAASGGRARGRRGYEAGRPVPAGKERKRVRRHSRGPGAQKAPPGGPSDGVPGADAPLPSGRGGNSGKRTRLSPSSTGPQEI